MHPNSLAIPLTLLATVQAIGASPSPLTTVRQIRELSPSAAAQAQPVRVRGVVTNFSGWRNSFFVQDDFAGISVDRRDSAPEVNPGDEVEITGHTSPGMFAPIIVSDRVVVAGRRELPPAPLLRFDEIAGGRQDAQRIRVRGVIRAAAVMNVWERRVLVLDLATGGGEISVRVREVPPAIPPDLIDAEVVVDGVCGTNFNDKRQFIGLRLFVNKLADIHIERAAPQDPFAAPAQSIGGLLQFSTAGIPTHRVKVVGTVTWQRQDRLLCIQNGDDGLYVQTQQTTDLVAGTRVEVSGFPATGQYSPVLENAIVRVTGATVPLAALPVKASEVIRRDTAMFLTAPYDARLIQVSGVLLQRLNDASGDELLVLRNESTVFRAVLESDAAGRRLEHLQNGSLVSVTGVCSVRTDESREPRSFQIELRSPRDVVVVQKPSWWSYRHTLQVLGASAILILITIVWGVLLQRQIRRQTAVIRQQVAVLTENEHALHGAQRELQKALEREQETARSDALTGLPNRRALQEACDREILRSQRFGNSFVLAYIDLDHFKTVNDVLGHDAGDRLLKGVGETLLRCLRATDVVARLGGDEFAALLPQTEAEVAGDVLEKVRGALLEVMARDRWPVTFSIGAVVCQHRVTTFEDLIRAADQVMYAVKRSGKNGVRVATDIGAAGE